MYRSVAAPCLVLMVASCSHPEPRYVPSSGWSDAWERKFHERWFGNQLRAMNEAPLALPYNPGAGRRIFRMLVLPSFDPAYSYRVEMDAAGGARLRWVRLNGKGGYSPGTIERDEVRELAAEEVHALEEALTAARLPDLPQDDPPLPRERTLPDGTVAIPICLDVTTYVFELLEPGKRSFVTRACGPFEPGLDVLMSVTENLRPVETKRF